MARPDGPDHSAQPEPASGLGPSGECSSRTPWRPIATAPKDRRTVLLIAAYPFGSTAWSDPRAGWWDGTSWTRWPHDFPPDFWAPITMPDRAQGIEARQGRDEGSARESPVAESHAPDQPAGREALAQED